MVLNGGVRRDNDIGLDDESKLILLRSTILPVPKVSKASEDEVERVRFQLNNLDHHKGLVHRNIRNEIYARSKACPAPKSPGRTASTPSTADEDLEAGKVATQRMIALLNAPYDPSKGDPSVPVKSSESKGIGQALASDRKRIALIMRAYDNSIEDQRILLQKRLTELGGTSKPSSRPATSSGQFSRSSLPSDDQRSETSNTPLKRPASRTEARVPILRRRTDDIPANLEATDRSKDRTSIRSEKDIEMLESPASPLAADGGQWTKTGSYIHQSRDPRRRAADK